MSDIETQNYVPEVFKKKLGGVWCTDSLPVTVLILKLYTNMLLRSVRVTLVLLLDIGKLLLARLWVHLSLARKQREYH